MKDETHECIVGLAGWCDTDWLATESERGKLEAVDDVYLEPFTFCPECGKRLVEDEPSKRKVVDLPARWDDESQSIEIDPLPAPQDPESIYRVSCLIPHPPKKST